ncbi:MAG: WecB/TagA/CpsF family glycosyltransferase [Lachnospiraceae bacterium]|nr:WecB/TagA/CpsF family glycosyltransferase [Lachnospiraceae bacterium]
MDLKKAAVREKERKRAYILGIPYVVSDISKAARYLLRHRKDLSGQYVCFSNAHTAVTGWEDPAYRTVQKEAALVFPDGNSIAVEMRARGYRRAERIAGPDFMTMLFSLGLKERVSHYFYGSSEETLEALRKSLSRTYPGIRIAGTYSPPFREISEEEDREHVERINKARPDFVWIGLGAPKQEKWMAAHKDRIKGVMLGVGAGFDFHSGKVKRAAPWIQKLGLEWLQRLMLDPKRLLKRYLVTNTKFIWYAKIKKR